jgi:hypothetical protein
VLEVASQEVGVSLDGYPQLNTRVLLPQVVPTSGNVGPSIDNGAKQLPHKRLLVPNIVVEWEHWMVKYEANDHLQRQRCFQVR